MSIEKAVERNQRHICEALEWARTIILAELGGAWLDVHFSKDEKFSCSTCLICAKSVGGLHYSCRSLEIDVTEHVKNETRHGNCPAWTKGDVDEH